MVVCVLQKKRLTQGANLFFCCLTRIRTSTDRTKTCSATITPWDNFCLSESNEACFNCRVRQKSALANHLLYLSKAMQSYDFLLDCPNIFVIIFKVFYKLLFYSVLVFKVKWFMMDFYSNLSFLAFNFQFSTFNFFLFLESFEWKYVNCYANCDNN